MALIDGRFEVGRVLGQGRMGIVHEAYDRETSSLVAIKVLTSHTGPAAARFAREAAVQATLVHENVVRYVAHGTTPDGAPYLAMERVDGDDLAEVLARRALGVLEAAVLARGVAAALAAAHARGVVHRDVKPSNVLLAGGDPRAPKLADFGVARVLGGATALTLTGHIVGTPSYMAPEQVRGGDGVDPLVDIFALGCVLYHCLAGRPPFEGADVRVVFAKILFGDTPRLATARREVPPELDALVAAMMEKDPTRRPRSSEEVVAALETIAP